MSFLDDAKKKAEAVSNALDSISGDQKTSAAAGAAEYVKGDPLSADDGTDVLFAGTTYDGADDKPNASDDGITLEFIHFGHAHYDVGAKFPHNSFDPENAKVAPEGHAIMFRDALEREAIMLFGFVSSCKVAVQDTTKGRGAIEEIGAMASSLLGGGNKTAKPDLAQLDTILEKIKTEAGKINKDQILYKEINNAGQQFQQIRADYTAFCASLDAFYLKPPKSEGIGAIGDVIGGAAASIPGVGKIIALVQRISFKMLDLYLATFLELRKNHEFSIELAAHELTVKAIKDDYKKYSLTYPVWFKKSESVKKEETKQTGDENKGKNGKSVEINSDKYTKPVTDKIEEQKKKAEAIRDSIYDFAGASGSPDKTPGGDALAKAFSALKGGGGDTSKGAKPGAADCIINGLNATLSDVGGVPEFLKTVIKELTAGNIALLEDVFARLMATGATEPIDSQDLLAGGRKYLTNKISSILTGLIAGMLTGGQDIKTDLLGGGKTLSAQQLIAKQMDERLGKFVEPVLQFMIGDLAGQLNKSRETAQQADAQTMEVMLGRLPWLVAMMFRNTFFPIWNLVAEEAMGQVSPPLKSALKAINEPLNKAKDVVDKAREYERRAEKTKEEADEAKERLSKVNLTTDEQQRNKELKDIKEQVGDVKEAPETETREGRERREERDAAAKEKENLDAFYQGNDKDKKFPVSARVVAGTGIKVKPEDEVPSVLP